MQAGWHSGTRYRWSRRLVVLVHGGNGKHGGLGGPGCREGRHSDGGSGDEPEPHGLAH